MTDIPDFIIRSQDRKRDIALKDAATDLAEEIQKERNSTSVPGPGGINAYESMAVGPAERAIRDSLHLLQLTEQKKEKEILDKFREIIDQRSRADQKYESASALAKQVLNRAGEKNISAIDIENLLNEITYLPHS